eukprot:Skav230870  [mRNA]  locus=scaffold1335:339684:344747:+ [translate_table: standard]
MSEESVGILSQPALVDRSKVKLSVNRDMEIKPQGTRSVPGAPSIMFMKVPVLLRRRLAHSRVSALVHTETDKKL